MDVWSIYHPIVVAKNKTDVLFAVYRFETGVSFYGKWNSSVLSNPLFFFLQNLHLKINSLRGTNQSLELRRVWAEFTRSHLQLCLG
jgi:hypothetical protein